MSFPVQTVWFILFAVVALFIASLILSIKFDDWFAKRINPYILEYLSGHDIDKFARDLKKMRPWAVTKNARNAMQVNWFCALLENERFEESRKLLEQIEHQAKTRVDWMNYHLLMAEYAEKTGDTQLAEKERQVSASLKTMVEQKLQNPRERATAGQCKQAFFAWLSFAIFLLMAGILCFYLAQNEILKDLGASSVTLSLLALPSAVVWLILWMVRKHKENAG